MVVRESLFARRLLQIQFQRARFPGRDHWSSPITKRTELPVFDWPKRLSGIPASRSTPAA